MYDGYLRVEDIAFCIDSVSRLPRTTTEGGLLDNLHPTKATHDMQRAENTAVGVAAAVTLHVTFIPHAVGGPAEDDTRAPVTLAAEAEGTAAAHEAFLPI